ncbi:MAG TPA: hypothetical protein VMY42_15510 [Thermoguttaceae bacterium]|nr:hypothetical protein [Thermoguttaceae bacterium]
MDDTRVLHTSVLARFGGSLSRIAVESVFVGSIFAAVVVMCFAAMGSQVEAAGVAVSVVADSSPGLGATHGLKKIVAALQAKGIDVDRPDAVSSAQGKIVIVAGLATGSGPAAELAKVGNVPVPDTAEALTIRHIELDDKPALLVLGWDDRGLMYAELDVADRIGWATDAENPISEVRDTLEKPYMPERALSIYTMHQKTFESFFYDEEYWARYLDMLAANRFNTFALLFGYENWGYFSPPYPYFFDVEGYPDVQVVGLTAEQQQKNLRALNRLIEMTHDRGLSITIGIWDHIYRGGVQGPTELAGKPTPGIVWGVTAENLVPYTKAALAKFLQEVPDVDAIQFRMHGESGLRRDEMEGFWTDVYRIMKEHGGDVRFDARAKNFPDSLIDRALEIGVPIRICTKFWMEQMGLPFHPTHVHPANQHDRRHGYADMLRYPKRYDMHWRIWSGGTTRVFLWGDPEYVRRIAASTLIYPGGGFEITAPMATKMQDQPHELEPFELLRPQYQYYDWEFERYWHFFQCFGRIGYNPETPPEVWRREFERRFGPAAAPYVEQALHRASWILPMAVAYCYPYNHFPTTRGWVERQRQEDLPVYAQSLPSDTQQFLSPDEAARNILEGIDSAKRTPWESSAWFQRTANEVLELVRQAEGLIGEHRNKEFDSTMVDLKMLAHLAMYHAWRAKAGVNWALYKRSNDLAALDKAIHYEMRATIAWDTMVEAAGDVYHDDIMMGRRGSGLSGHWQDELVKLEAGVEKLQEERDNYRRGSGEKVLCVAHVPVRKVAPGKDLVLRATVSDWEDPFPEVHVGLRYPDGASSYVQMQRKGMFVYRATIPVEKVTSGMSYFIEAVVLDGRKAAYPAEAPKNRITVDVTDDHRAPIVTHEPIATAPVGKPLKVSAVVRDPSGVKWVRLRYRSVNQYEDYRTLEMVPVGDDRYEAVVPGEHVVPEWDFMYLIEVMDVHGNGQIHPDLEKEMPYIVVHLQRQ